MLQEIRNVLNRAQSAIWTDLAGGIGLMALLYGGLQLPGLI